MNFAENYFSKHRYYLPDIIEPPSGLLFFSVVIPVYLEEHLLRTLEALRDTLPSNNDVEVLLVFNYSELDNPNNKESVRKDYHSVTEWCSENNTSSLRFIPILADQLPDKHAGAGLARKIGMDTALSRFDSLNNPQGLILSLDADTLVEKNYFVAIKNSMLNREDLGACTINFEHPITGTEFSEDVYNAIIQYELHLRYYKHILGFVGFPYSNYTIGSCFGVRSGIYAKHGGMNRRKAGEDFYFLNKLFPHISFKNIQDTCVYPSPRPSKRVPFGTGPVIHRLISQTEKEFQTYMPQAFFSLESLSSAVPDLYITESFNVIFESLDIPLKEFLVSVGIKERLKEIRRNTSSVASFEKRFSIWFDGFKVVKYLNFAHEFHYTKIPVQQAVEEFLKKAQLPYKTTNARDFLLLFRKLDKEGKTLKIN